MVLTDLLETKICANCHYCEMAGTFAFCWLKDLDTEVELDRKGCKKWTKKENEQAKVGTKC